MTQGLPQYLNYARFIAPGVIALRDGAFLTAFEYWGPDQEYADYVSMEALANQINGDLAKLGNGWMLQAEAIRVPVVIPPSGNHCPDPVSQLVAEERAREYLKEQAHFETRLTLTLTWLPPSDVGQKFSHFFFGARRIGAKPSRQALLAIFQRETQHLADALGHFLKLRRLTDDELTKFLYHCLTGEDKNIGTAPDGGRLNYALGAVPMEPHRGIVGRLHARVVGVYGFPRGATPQMLDDLLQLPMALRLSQRFIFLSPRKAVKELELKRNTWGYYNWYNPKRIGWSATKNVTGADANSTTVVGRNSDADNQVESIEREITKLQEGASRGGYYTLAVVLRDAEEDVVEARAQEIVQILNRKGFMAVVETDNFPAAFKGSLPGHGTSNVRKPRLTTEHLVRLVPLSSPWRGHDAHPSPLYPPNSGPLIICKSTGSTPFFFTPALHTLVIGPTGAGKTVALNAMALAQLQYKNAQVFTFDRDAGGVVPCLAAGGEYFDLDARQYAPLAHIDQEDEFAWALDYCERLVRLRDVPLTPQGRIAVQNALTHLASAPVPHRTMTGLLGQLQTSDEGLRAALAYYAGTMPGAIIDGAYSPTADSHWLNFDMDQVQKRSEAVRVPVLLAQFHELDRRMANGYPTQFHIDEGWMVAADVLLRDFIEAGSATLRKKVVSMTLVLHSPEDLNVFPHAGRLLNNITTYIFLPNEMADSEAVRPHYQALGLGRREIKKIATEMIPRRHYYVMEGKQRRMFALPWGPWQQALLGVNGRDWRRQILEMRQTHGAGWVRHWLESRGLSELAAQHTRWEQQNVGKEQQHAA